MVPRLPAGRRVHKVHLARDQRSETGKIGPRFVRGGAALTAWDEHDFTDPPTWMLVGGKTPATS